MNDSLEVESAVATSPPGPPLLVPAGIFAAMTIAAAVIGAGGPRPDAPPAAVLAYTAAHPTALSVGAFLLVGSAFPLAVLAATLVRRFRTLGVTAPGPVMGLAGAVLAAGSLMLSGLVSWAAVQTAGLGDAGLARLLAVLWFGFGGIGFVAPFGLLILGTAVPALITRTLPRPVAWAGLVVGGLAALTPVALLTTALYPLLPVGRFGGVLFLIVVAVLLPGARRADA